MKFSKFSSVYEISDSKNKFFYLIRHSILNYSYFLNEEEFSKLIENIKNNNFNNIPEEIQKSHILVEDDYSEKLFLDYLQKQNNKFFV